MNEIFTQPIRFERITADELPSHPKSFTEVLHTLMFDSIQISIQQVQLIQSKLDTIFNQAFDRILRSHQNSNSIYDGILSDFEKLFQKDNKQLHPCVRKQMEVIQNITLNGQDNALKCVDSAINEIKNIQESVAPYMESINSLIKNINEVTERCSQSANRIAIGICVVQNVCFESVSKSAEN